jgi:hypothetical protein
MRAPPVVLLLALACASDPSSPAEPRAGFRLSLDAAGAAPATLDGDSTAWRNEGSPYHRVFRLVLNSPAAPPGYPAGEVRIHVAGYGSALAGTSVPIVGTWPVVPGTSALGTSATFEMSEGWRGTAVGGALVIEAADAEEVTGSLDLELAVQQDLEPRPPVTVRGSFRARAWEE